MYFRLACCLGLVAWASLVQAGALQSVADKVSAAAGMPNLETSPLPPGVVELRIWTGFGVVAPDHMLRLQRAADGKVSGERLRYFPADLSYMGDYAAGFRRQARHGCGRLHHDEETEVCVLARQPQPGWHRIYESLLKLGITTLPDDSQLPPPKLQMTDGYAIHVEVREGADYRNYSYSNPGMIDAPEARAMLKISDIVSRLFD